MISSQGFLKKTLKARRLGLTVLVVIAAIVLAVVALPAKPVDRGPTVEWMPPAVNTTVAAGTNRQIDVVLTAHTSVSGASIEVVPALASVMSVEPTALPPLAASQQVTIHLRFSPPSSTPIGELDGTVHVRQGDTTLSKPLPISLVIWPAATSATSFLSIGYPPSWYVNTAAASLGGPISIRSFSTYSSGGIRPFGGAEIDATRIPDNGIPLSSVIGAELQGAYITATSSAQVAGANGLRVTYEDQYPTYREKSVAVYVLRNGFIYKFYLSYSAGDPNETMHVSDFDQVLSTAVFSN